MTITLRHQSLRKRAPTKPNLNTFQLDKLPCSVLLTLYFSIFPIKIQSQKAPMDGILEKIQKYRALMLFSTNSSLQKIPNQRFFFSMDFVV